jgi:prolyl 4-hydroxylase
MKLEFGHEKHFVLLTTGSPVEFPMPATGSLDLPSPSRPSPPARWLSPPDESGAGGPRFRERRISDILKKPLTSEVFLIDHFLSHAECDLILEELRFAIWRPSLTYMLQQDGTRRDVLSPYRVSETAQQKWFSDELQARVTEIERRFEEMFCLEKANLEYWQGTDYPAGGSFYYHLDSGYWEDHYAGDRILTLLLYLTTPVEGGGTHFRALDRTVEAKAGRLLVWNNLFQDEKCNYRMIHSSVPLIEGRKTTLITWLRQKKFRFFNFAWGDHHG